MFSLLLFISTKILLITYVKCDFVCRTNSQLQMLSSFQCNVQISCTLLLRSIYEDGVCVCNVHAIKCLEPHVIYHEDDTCVQTKLKSSTQLLCTKQRSFRRGIPRTRSHYQCVYFHLHLSFFFFGLISFPVVNITIPVQKIFVFLEHLTTWCRLPLSFFSVCLCIRLQYLDFFLKTIHIIRRTVYGIYFEFDVFFLCSFSISKNLPLKRMSVWQSW